MATFHRRDRVHTCITSCAVRVVSGSVVVLEIGLFEGLGLVSESTAFLLGLVSVSDKEDSGFYFKTGQDHNCGDITK